MADGINEVTLLGNVGANPGIRTMQNGNKVANFNLATSRSYKKDGVRHEKTEWHRIVIMNPHIIPVVDQFVRKGTRLWIRGELRTRKWTDQNNVERWTTEIVVDFDGKMSLQDVGGGNRQGAGTDGVGNQNEPPPGDAGGYADGSGWTPPEEEEEMPV